jgi:hypothetical protein
VGVLTWPWQFELPPLDPQRYALVVLEEQGRRSPFDREYLERRGPVYFVTSSVQFGKIEKALTPKTDVERFWRFLLLDGAVYRVQRIFGRGADEWQGRDLIGRLRPVLEVFGREIELSQYPEDMQYVNPVIVVLEREAQEAVVSGGGG